MNWYKKAFPIMKERPGMGYLNIGHKDISVSGVWLIDTDYHLHSAPLDRNIEGHGTWDVWSKNYSLRISAGRWTKENEDYVVSIGTMGREYHSKTESQKQYIKERVEKILDEGFNNPKILDFS